MSNRNATVSFPMPHNQLSAPKRGKGPHGKRELRKIRLKIQALNHPVPDKPKGANKRTSDNSWTD